jgi:hypothetical protein
MRLSASMSHVRSHADDLVDHRRNGQVALAPPSLHDLDGDRVSQPHAQPLGETAGERHTLRRDGDRTQGRVVRAAQLAAGGQADHRREVAAVRGAQAHRHDALALDEQHARLARQFADDGAVQRMREGHRHVAALDEAELDLDHVVDGVLPEQAEHDHRHGERDAEDR